MSDSFFRTFVPEDEPALPEADTGVAHIARVYDYWLGGKDHFAADREVGDRVLEIHPETVQSVRANRGFLARSVRYLAYKEGIRQFLDIGTGLPSANNTHEVAQATARQARVVYVDNDPIVLAHARALLTSGPDGATAYPGRRRTGHRPGPGRSRATAGLQRARRRHAGRPAAHDSG